MRRIALLAALTALALAGCARKERAPAPAPAVTKAPRPPVVIRPLFPADYVATAGSIDLFEIRSGELAMQRSSEARHRDFAEMMIAAHRGTSAQLSFSGRRLNLLPSAILLPQHQAMLDELSASANFDATYRRQQIAVHEAALKLHSDFAARGESNTLRTVARNAAPIVRRHLEMLRRM